MERLQFDPEDLTRLIELAFQYGGIVIVVLSLLFALLGRGRRRERREREVALGQTRAEAEPIGPGDDTGKLSRRMDDWRQTPNDRSF